MTEKTYEEGLRDGRLSNLENHIAEHANRLSKIEKTLAAQERITYGMLAIIAFINFFPKIETFFGG